MWLLEITVFDYPLNTSNSHNTREATPETAERVVE